MASAEITIQADSASELVEVVELLDDLDVSVTVVSDSGEIEHQLSDFGSDDSAVEVARIDPADILFDTDRQSKLSGTDVQERILGEIAVLASQGHDGVSIAEVASDVDSSPSYVRTVLASVEPSEIADSSNGRVESPPTIAPGLFKGEEIQSDDRELRRPDSDTRMYKYLIEVLCHGPGTIRDIARESSFHKSKLDSSIPELYDFKLVNRSRSVTFGEVYCYWVSPEGLELLSERGDITVPTFKHEQMEEQETVTI